MRWAQEAAGARVVAALPLESQWLANHLLVLGDGRELVLRRWARPGWERDDPDLTAAREALVLERLADTPVPAPELVAADPDAAACDVPALLITRVPGRGLPGAPAARAARRRRWPRSTPSIPPASRPTGATTSPTGWRCRRGPATATCGSARSRWPTRRRPSCPSASSTATSIPATRCGRAPSSPAWSTGRPARAGRRRSTSATCAGTSRSTTASAWPTRVLPHPEHHPYYDVVTALDVLPEPRRELPHAELLRLEEHVARALDATRLSPRPRRTKGGLWAALRVRMTG